MAIILAFDSYKDSLTSSQAASCFSRGFKKVNRTMALRSIQLSDGGEGFLDAMLQDGKGRRFKRTVSGPLGRPCTAAFGMRPGKVGIIEMASASGLEQVPPRARNPMKTTSYGTGQLMAEALKQGARKLILGVGGSATVDGGIGMAQALGVRFYDTRGLEIKRRLKGADLHEIRSMNCDRLLPAFREASIIVACDVTNPLCGKSGAARVFGPQKGATPAMVKSLETSLNTLGGLLETHCGQSIRTLPGSGAAGGITAMLAAIGQTTLKEGAPLVLKAAGFEKHLTKASLVVTGEGSIDSQTAQGKAVMGVINAAAARAVPIIAIGGRVVERELTPLYRQGLSLALSLTNQPCLLSEALDRAPVAMEEMGSRVARMLALNSITRA
jgi:glycerate kinase